MQASEKIAWLLLPEQKSLALQASKKIAQGGDKAAVSAVDVAQTVADQAEPTAEKFIQRVEKEAHELTANADFHSKDVADEYQKGAKVSRHHGDRLAAEELVLTIMLNNALLATSCINNPKMHFWPQCLERSLAASVAESIYIAMPVD